MSNQSKNKLQWGIAALIIIVVVILAWWVSSSKSSTEKHDEHKDEQHTEKDEHQHNQTAHDDEHDEAKELEFSVQQLTEFGIKLAKVERGVVQQTTAFPAKLVANTDLQAHISSTFAGRVDRVAVNLGDTVKKGQILAVLFIPELVDQQANLDISRETLTLAQQDYQREKQLFDQGISARQDYQRAYNSYRQAQIQVQAAQSRLNALGAAGGSQGRYVLTSPLNGVISAKDIVVGEQVTSAKQLFVVDQLDQLWVEFVLPSHQATQVLPNQNIQFKSLQTGHVFKAQVQALNTEADAQSGRLVIRAKVTTPAQELRPNLMVNVELNHSQSQSVLRVNKQAIQQVDGKSVIFIAEQDKDKLHLSPVTVEIGQYSSDGQWVEVKSGLTEQQQYVAQGSFLLKSELEKGEAAHEH